MKLKIQINKSNPSDKNANIIYTSQNSLFKPTKKILLFDFLIRILQFKM